MGNMDVDLKFQSIEHPELKYVAYFHPILNRKMRKLQLHGIEPTIILMNQPELSLLSVEQQNLHGLHLNLH